MEYGSVLNDTAIPTDVMIIDLRSDTITKPTYKMREAMFNADVGDDVFEEDRTVKKLEANAAELTGKGAALFVTSGTMGNLIAVLCHCNERGSEAYCGEESHVYLHEQGGVAALGGVMLTTLPNNRDGTFDLEKLQSKFRRDRIHEPISKLVLVENTINGKVIPQTWLEELAKIARERGLKLHMDGARLWNASVASGIPAKEIVSSFDSVTFCLSKGLGAPVGSLLCGTKDFIRNARRVRKALGGGMRQVGVLAAAGLVALEEIVPLLKHDHKRALMIAREIKNMGSRMFDVDLDMIQTNIIFVQTNPELITAMTFVERLQQIRDDNSDDKVIVRGLALTKSSARFVLYHQISDEMVEAAIRKFKYVIKMADCDV